MKITKWQWALAGIGLAWIVLRATKPQWYQDLMLRAFAADVPSDAEKAKLTQQQVEQAADLAARYLLPLGWVIRAGELATGVTLEQAIQKVQAKVIAMGPPVDAKPETLAQYKDSALAAAKGST